MALSGVFWTNVGSSMYLKGKWEATQDITANTSTITLKTYWGSRSGAVYSSASKDTYSTISGTKDTATFTAGLSGGQEKLINTQTKTITHNADGTAPSVALVCYAELGLTLSGTYYGSATAKDTADLNTIPRNSTLKSNPDYMFPEKTVKFSLNRAKSSFTHTVDFSAGANGSWTVLQTATNVEESGTFTLTDANITSMMARGYNGDGEVRYRITTFDGGTQVGSVLTVTGKLELPQRATIFAGTSEMGEIEANKPILLTQENNTPQADGSNLYDLKITVMDENGVVIETLPTFNKTYEWTPSYELYKPYIAGAGAFIQLQVDSYYKTTQIRPSSNGIYKYATITIPQTPPLFNPTITVYDTNADMVGLTGNASLLVQGKSVLAVAIDKQAEAQDGKTLESYTITIGSKTIEVSPTTGAQVFNFGTVNFSGNATVKIVATDSNGNSTTVTRQISVIPYVAPKVTAMSVKRANGYDTTLNLSFGGKYSPLIINGVAKNTITKLEYQYAVEGGTMSAWTELARTINGDTYQSVVGQVLDTDQTKGYNVNFRVSDSLGGVSTASTTVSAGIPQFMIDEKLNSVGVNMFPKNPNSFEVAGKIYSSKGMEATAGALELGAKTTAEKVVGDKLELSWNEATNSMVVEKVSSSGVRTPIEIVSGGAKFFNDGDFEFATGFATLRNTIANSDTRVQATVSYGRTFSAVPNVYASVASSVVGTSVHGVSAMGATTTGCDLYLHRNSAPTDTKVYWLAVLDKR